MELVHQTSAYISDKDIILALRSLLKGSAFTT